MWSFQDMWPRTWTATQELQPEDSVVGVIEHEILLGEINTHWFLTHLYNFALVELQRDYDYVLVFIFNK